MDFIGDVTNKFPKCIFEKSRTETRSSNSYRKNNRKIGNAIKKPNCVVNYNNSIGGVYMRDFSMHYYRFFFYKL